MPNSLMMADANFPRFNGGESTEKKIEAIQSYLFMLTEELRWAHANIGRENFNETGFKEISNLITEPIEVQLENEIGEEGRITLEVQGLQTEFKDAKEHITTISQTVNSITLEVENGDTSSVINLKANGAVIASPIIEMKGMVTFAALIDEGTTEINGANITTGTISAIDLDACTITGGTINGTIYRCSLVAGEYNPTGEIKMYYKWEEYEENAGGLRLEYDEGVSPSDPENSRYRMRLYTRNGDRPVSLKLESANRMSLEAANILYMNGSRITIGADAYIAIGGNTEIEGNLSINGNLVINGTINGKTV